MPKSAVARATADPTKRAAARPAKTGGKADPALGALQARADDSAAVSQLRVLQRQADLVLQREGDDDDGYDADDEAPEALTLIASMDGDKIGSVYIGSGRVRTTHVGGPKADQHDDRETIRFHIDKAAAKAAFKKAVPDYADKKKYPDGVSKTKSRWIGRTLAGASPDALPPWATLIPDADSAFSSANVPEASGKQLFEIFKTAGVYTGYHPSRGVAVKFETDSDTMDTLRAAAAKVAKIKDANAKNEAFYDYLVKNAPEFAAMIRTPEEVAS